MRASGIGNLLSNHTCCDTARQCSSGGRSPGPVAISGCQLPAFLCSAIISPGACRHFGHDDVSRRMEFGIKDGFEQSHGFLDEARLLLGRIGAGSDRGIDMNRNLRRRAPDGPAGTCSTSTLVRSARLPRTEAINSVISTWRSETWFDASVGPETVMRIKGMGRSII